MQTTHTPASGGSLPRPLRIAILSALALTVAGGVAVSFTQRAEKSSVVEREYPAVATVNVINEWGDLQVTAARTDRIALRRTATWAGPDGPREPVATAGALTLRGCAVPWWKELASFRSCSIDDSVTVPADASVSVTTEMGSTSLTGAYGKVDVRTDVGDVRSPSLSTDSFSATVGVGSIDLTLTNRPTRIVVRSDIGDIVLRVPAGGYQVRTFNDIGSSSVDPTLVDGASAFVIDAGVGIGDIRIEVAR